MNKKIILAALITTSLFLTACDSGKAPAEKPEENTAVTETQAETNDDDLDDVNDDMDETDDQDDMDDDSNEAAKQHDEQYSYVDAIEMFKEQFPSSNITKVSYEFDERYQYEVAGMEGNMENTLELDAKSGQTNVKSENEDDDDDAQTINQQYLDKIGDMINKALDDFSAKNGGQNMLAKEWSLDFDDGVLEFEAEVKDGGKSQDFKYNVVDEF